MADMDAFPVIPEYAAIESAIDFFDETEKTYFEACDTFKAYRPVALTVGTVLVTAEKHIRAFSRSLEPLLEDTEIGEFARISGRLMVIRESKRVQHLNELLGDTIIHPLLGKKDVDFPDTIDKPRDEKAIAAKMRIFDISSRAFESRVMDDTRLFLDTAHNY